jgi:cytochrome c5
MSKPFLVLSALTLLAIAATPGLGKMPQEAGGKNGAKAAAAESGARAKKLYAMDCSMCHGDHGNGQTDLATSMELKLEDWNDPKSLADKPDQALFEIIRKGKDKMPPEDASRAKDDDVKALILYIRDFSKNPAPAAAPAPAPAAAAPAANSPSN